MNESKAARYQRLTRRGRVAQVACGGALLACLALTRASRDLADFAFSIAHVFPLFVRTSIAALAFLVLTLLLWEVVSLPVVLYLGLNVDRRFGRAEQTAPGVLAAQLQGTLIGLGAAVIAAAVVLIAVHWAGDFWWAPAGGALALALLGALEMAPTLLPVLGQTKPVARRSLMSALREIARRAGVPVSDILEWQVADGATALVAGAGRTCRVFIAAEVVREWSDDEIAVVVAHELAHHVYRDLWRALALNVLLLSIALWVAGQGVSTWAGSLGLHGPGDLASLPLIAMIGGGFWLAATPLRLAQSRAHERRADRFALKLTGEADAFGAAVRRLSARYLADERPSSFARWFFYRHPPVSERLALAEHYRRN